MPEKQITINQLAKMIKKGFDNTPTKGQFENLDKRLVEVEKDVKDIKLKLDKTDVIEKRVDYIENILDIPAKKS